MRMSNHLKKGKHQSCKQSVLVADVFISAVYETRMFISQLKCCLKCYMFVCTDWVRS